MLSEHQISIFDRIKELTYTIGTGNVLLSGPAGGFSSFSSSYSYGDNLFYAITDGTRYEIGSGIYASGNQIIRLPFRSTNNNALVSFPEGVKEVFATYPATHSVFTASGIQDYSAPRSSGIAYWSSANIINYDIALIWDDVNNRLGLQREAPSYAIDIGGEDNYSLIRSSGLLVGSSGIYFPPANNGDISYEGGRQLAHYEINRLDDYAYDNELIDQLTGSSEVLELSGVVNQYILLKRQNAGTVFSGPQSGCTPPCSPAYPSFRTLVFDDIPDLSSRYATNANLAVASGDLNNKIISLSGIVINNRNEVINISGILTQNVTAVSGLVNNNTSTLSGIINTNTGMLSGIIENRITNVYSIFDSTINSLNSTIIDISGIFDNRYNELASLSGLLTNHINNVSGVLYQAILDCCTTTTTTTTSTTTTTTTPGP
jgi:hypothetical protein